MAQTTVALKAVWRVDYLGSMMAAPLVDQLAARKVMLMVVLMADQMADQMVDKMVDRRVDLRAPLSVVLMGGP